MGVKLQSELDKARKNAVPGPGQYVASADSVKTSAPKFGFGSSKRPELGKKTIGPGPGAYRLPARIAEVPEYALQGRS